MKTLGFLLLTVGFLGGAFYAVKSEVNEVNWTLFVPFALTAAIGVAMSRFADRRVAQEVIADGGGLEELRAALDRIVDNVRALDAAKAGMNPYEFHSRIDEFFPTDLLIFVEARKRIGDIHGLQSYAEVMNEFAAGERYLNRVWSASADGYIDEVLKYVTRSRTQFEQTQQILARLEAA